jgi:levansucrase
LRDCELNLKTNLHGVPALAPPCSLWTAAQLALVGSQKRPEAPLITAAQAQPAIPGLTTWDVWPVQLDDGQVADIGSGSLWVVLSAPRRDDPDLRHNEARMRLMLRTDTGWLDCGDLLPDDFAPGSREWSGSTRLEPATGKITLWFTAAGRRGAGAVDFEQRLFHATGKLDLTGTLPRIVDWAGLTQSVTNDGRYYADLSTRQGVPGRIKGFRDPYWFRDPANGQGYILFTGSKSADASRSDYDGVIGIAALQEDETFTLLPPIVDADGLANELERPHIIVHNGLYYLFWSSQSYVFSPDGTIGPTGLYGMVAPSLFGPYVPLNGSGLVLTNPAAEPRQAYAWQVLPSLEVVSFVEYWGLAGRDIESNPALKLSQFGGTIAPMVRISLKAATTQIVADNA